MNFYPKVTKEDLITLCELAEQQNNQRAIKCKSRILIQTRVRNLAENLSPITEKVDEVNESTKKIGEIVKNQMLRTETHKYKLYKKTSTQSLRDYLTLSKRSKNVFKLGDKSDGDVFWKGVIVQPLGQKRLKVKDEEYDITPNIQEYFTNTKLTTKCLENNEKETVFDILNNVGFYDMKHTKR